MKSVRFSEKVVVHRIGVDDFIRGGLSSAADRYRFQLRIQRTGSIINEVLRKKLENMKRE